MPDREKVIKAAEICLQYIEDGDCPTECPYFDLCAKYEKRVVFQPLIRDALALLKEQGAVEPRVSSAEQRCGNCNKVIEMDGWKACPWCGKMIDWERWWSKNGTHDNT